MTDYSININLKENFMLGKSNASLCKGNILFGLLFFMFFQCSLVQANNYQVDVGGDYSCALDDKGVVCWGDNIFGQITVPELSNPTQVTVGRNRACALDDTGVVCWGVMVKFYWKYFKPLFSFL